MTHVFVGLFFACAIFFDALSMQSIINALRQGEANAVYAGQIRNAGRFDFSQATKTG
jgi:hypothetical protein